LHREEPGIRLLIFARSHISSERRAGRGNTFHVRLPYS
jgi:hypothetical protein